MKAFGRDKKIIRLLRLTWDSLNSHLKPLNSRKKIPKKMVAYFGGKKFDKKCVKDYAEMMKHLADLL